MYIHTIQLKQHVVKSIAIIKVRSNLPKYWQWQDSAKLVVKQILYIHDACKAESNHGIHIIINKITEPKKKPSFYSKKIK